MRKSIKAAVFTLLTIPAAVSLADGTSGCGLGSQVFKGKTGVASHILALTTNGIFSNQMFGITMGTLGCDSTQVVSNDYQRNTFVANNMDNLAHDIAQGQGEHLASLSELMGIAKEDKPAFFNLTQQNYDTLIGSEDVTAGQFLSSLDKIVVAQLTVK